MSTDYDKPIGPWVRRAREHGAGVIKKLTAAELAASVIHVDERVVVINKSGDIPCHPSKDGPWSSLSGAVREHFGDAAAHLVFRLDRETSGVVVYARDPATARRLQMAVQNRRYSKAYLAILHGELRESTFVDQPLGPDYDSPVNIKNKVVRKGQGQEARTRFEPLQCSRGFTLARVTTETGRKHQIRAHAEWLGHPLVGDKIYGPDARLFLEFIETGWTSRLAERLLLSRQALHCAEIDLRAAGVDYVFQAPMAEDMVDFCRQRGFLQGRLQACIAFEKLKQAWQPALRNTMTLMLENPKLLSLEQAVAAREKMRAEGRKLVLTNGVFDLLHTGHLYYLQKARALGGGRGALFIALNSDASVKALKGPLRPVQNEEQRAYALAATWFVDGVFVFREPRLAAEILALKPDIYTKAGDYTLEKLDAGEREALQKVGARIEFLPFLPGFSTTDLIAKIKAAGGV